MSFIPCFYIFYRERMLESPKRNFCCCCSSSWHHIMISAKNGTKNVETCCSSLASLYILSCYFLQTFQFQTNLSIVILLVIESGKIFFHDVFFWRCITRTSVKHILKNWQSNLLESYQKQKEYDRTGTSSR